LSGASDGNVQGYQDALAYIHDVGYSDYALGAAPGLLRILKKKGIASGLVVDLGCGSGRWARELNRAGYDVLGVDQSRAMIRLARRIAPKSRFKVASLWSAALPPCRAITSIGECLNYRFDPVESKSALGRLFKRAFGALRPGGVFICDFAGPGRAPKGGRREHSSAGRDWSVTAKTTTHSRGVLRRHVVALRRIGGRQRRSVEIHYLRLHTPAEISRELARCGFRVRSVGGYGRFRFPAGIHGVVAEKPE
jgi:SAM-dependent methyltransferase